MDCHSRGHRVIWFVFFRVILRGCCVSKHYHTKGSLDVDNNLAPDTHLAGFIFNPKVFTATANGGGDYGFPVCVGQPFFALFVGLIGLILQVIETCTWIFLELSICNNRNIAPSEVPYAITRNHAYADYRTYTMMISGNLMIIQSHGAAAYSFYCITIELPTLVFSFDVC